MFFLYHRVPVPMLGKVLYPLSGLPSLGQRGQSLHDTLSARYSTRRHLRELVLPKLNCSWHDVLFFSAVHPQTMRDALRKVGIEWPQMQSFEIRPSLLAPSKTILLLGTANPANEFEYEEYDADDVGQYTEIPKRTLEHYRESKALGVRPFLFHGIAHVLYRGTLNIAGLPVRKGR